MRGNGWMLALVLAGAGLATAQEVVPYANPGPPPVPAIQQTSAIMPLPAADFSPQGPYGAGQVGPTILPLDGAVPGLPAHLRSPWLIEGEYLLWWFRDADQLPVGFAGVTTIDDFLNSFGGRLNNITPLVGNATAFDFGTQSGVRVTMTAYIDEMQSLGCDMSWMQFLRDEVSDTYASNGDVLLGPTFIETDGTRSLVLASFPAALTVGDTIFRQGRSAVVQVESEGRLWGAEMNGRMRIPCILFDSIWLLGGARHLQYGEGVGIETYSRPLPGSTAVSTIELRDSFTVLNQFWGAQCGLHARTQFGRLSLDLIGKSALGGMYEQVKVTGETIVTTPLSVQRLPGGVLAQRTNIGSVSSGRMAWVGEVAVKGGWNFSDHCRATIGYNFLGINNMVRVVNAVDVVDSRGVPVLDTYDPAVVATRPAPPSLQESYWWAQGLTFGFDVAF